MNAPDGTPLGTRDEWLRAGFRIGSPALARYRWKDPVSGKSIPLYTRDDVVDLCNGTVIDTKPEATECGPTI